MIEVATAFLFLAVEEVIPPDHPAAILAIPIGLLFLSGSVYVLLWSNYGAKKAGAIYGVAFFGFAFLLGVFWWFGGPGIPPGLGISHLPGQAGDNYVDRWYPFEQGSERAEFFGVTENPDAFQPLEEFGGVTGLSEDAVQADRAYTALVGSVGGALGGMQDQFLPVDDNGVAQIGVDRRTSYEEDAEAARPDGAEGRAAPFFGATQVGEPRAVEDPDTGVLVVAHDFQATATFVDGDDVPLDPVPVGEVETWYAFYDPGAVWLPSALWTAISLVFFLISLFWLDRLEMRDKKRDVIEVEESETPAVPVAQ
jgi:hypothetical protein